MAMTLSAYFWRDWVHMQLTVALMASSTLLLYFLVRGAMKLGNTV
jgi:hypothetical protein